MVCGFTLSFYLARKDAQLVMNNHKLGFRGDNTDGDVKSYCGNEKHIHIFISESNPAWVRLKGCLPMYYKGRNDGSFTFGEIKEAVNKLMTEYMVPENAPLHHLELSLNLPFDCPKVVINSAMLYNGRVRQPIRRKNYYGSVWPFEDKNGRVFYEVKLYKKGKTLIRYELHLEDLRKIKTTGIKVISDLLDENKLIRALFFLYKSIDKFVFIPEDNKHKLPPPLSVDWNCYRIDTEWDKVSSRDMKDKKSNAIKKIVDAIHVYDLIDWQNIMKQRFLVAAAQEAEISEQALMTTFSQLECLCETVAGTVRTRDRQTDSKMMARVVEISKHAFTVALWLHGFECNKVTGPTRNCGFDKKDVFSSSSRSNVLLSLTVANGGLSRIFGLVRVYSNVHQGGRGPPAAKIRRNLLLTNI